MRLKIRLEEGGFLPLMVLLAVIFLSLAFIFGLFGLFSDRVTAIIIDGDGEVCGPGEFLCGPSGNGLCCLRSSERCVSGQCVSITPNGTFFDVQNTAYCSINTPAAGYCGGSCKKTIQIMPDACTRKITLTSVLLNDEGETAANGSVLVKDYSCTCRAGSTPRPLGSCAIYPNGTDGSCGGGTNCGSETGDGFGGGQCTGTRTYNLDVPFTRGTPLSAYIYAIDDCRSRGAGLWGEGRAIYTENRLRCDTGFKCDASTGSPRCVLLCGDGICDPSENITSCPQDCTPPQESPNNPKGFLRGLHCIPGEVCDADPSCPQIEGWTCDADNYKAALDVEIYADGLRNFGDGNFIGNVRANITREQAVANECGNNSNHGFVFDIPKDFKDGANHEIYAYGINIDLGNDTLLTNSPITINCAPPQICGNGVKEPGEQCDDGNTNNGDGCSSTCQIEPPPPRCVLNSASWSVNQTVEGNVVGLRVTTTNCQNETLSFVVKEDDPLFDDPVNRNPPNVTIRSNGGITSSNWTAEWPDTEGETDPTYYFTATLISTGENIRSSNELQVFQQAPLFCDGVVTCSNYLNQQYCENDICSIAENFECSNPGSIAFCSWNNATSTCGPACPVTDDGSKTGTCFNNENIADTCDDDGFLTVYFNATWIWDPGCDNTCRADNQEAASKCQSTTEIFQCPAQIPLPFFGFYNALASIVLIAVIYWTISLREKRKRKNR